MGWYSALACAGALSPMNGFAVVNTMGTLMQESLIGGQTIYPFVGEDWLPDAARKTGLLALVDDIAARPDRALALSIDLGGMLVLAGNEAGLAAFEAEASRLDAGVKVVRPEAGVDLRRFFTVPALVPETDGAAEALARRLTGDNATHVVSYGTEAGHFQKNGYSCVVCGPGDIAQAHQRDEYIELSEFRAGAAFMENIVAELCK